MRPVYVSRALQQPRRVCGVERRQHRVHVFLLAGVRWSDLRRLRRWLHHLPDMHAVHVSCALQQPCNILDAEWGQHGVRVYVQRRLHRPHVR